MAVAFFLGLTFQLKRSQRSFAIAASMFMNSNSLPIALMQSLVVSVPALRWEADDDKNSMLARALTYLVLYSTLGMVVRWSYGVRLLSQADPEGVTEGEYDEQIPRNSDASDNERGPETIRVLRAPPPLGAARRQNTGFYSFPNTPGSEVVPLPDSFQTPYGSDEDEDSDNELPRPRAITEPTRSRLQSILRKTKRRIVKFAKAVNEFMTVPLWAALASLIVACVAPLQEFLKNDVQPIRGALNNAGNCSIPLTLVVLGAYFYSSPPEDKGTPRRIESRQSDSTLSYSGSIRTLLKLTDTSKGKRRSRDNSSERGETKTVIIAIASRMIITPGLLMPLIVLCAKSNWHEVFDEWVSCFPISFYSTSSADPRLSSFSPVFIVSNVLLVSAPPALTLAQVR